MFGRSAGSDSFGEKRKTSVWKSHTGEKESTKNWDSENRIII